jgi:tripartite-type tricarboxylate transporter receptor subunit TctC
MTHTITQALLGSVVALAVVFPFTLSAQPSVFPVKPVRLIVPYATGGGTDILARLFAQKLGMQWNTSVIVENHPGANTNIGSALVAKANADGYTLLLGTPANVINPQIYRALPYDIQKDFKAVALLGDVPNILLIKKSLDVRTLAELLALARQKPGDLNYASGGIGSPQHFSLELLKYEAGVTITHVPYKGGGPATNDLLAGHVDMMASSAVLALPHIKSGSVKALAVASAVRLKALPDVPTARESGLPGFEASTWFGLLAPSGTSDKVIEYINKSVLLEMHSADIIEKLAQMGASPNQMQPVQFATFLNNEYLKWGKVIKTAGIVAE